MVWSGWSSAVLLASLHYAAATACNGEVWGKTCPDAAPVCCFQPNGAAAGCCPADHTCDLSHGDCVHSSGRRERVFQGGSFITLKPSDIVVALCVMLLCLTLVVLRLAWKELRSRRRTDDDAERPPIAYTQLPQHLKPPESDTDESVSDDEQTEYLRRVCSRRAPSPPPAADSDDDLEMKDVGSGEEEGDAERPSEQLRAPHAGDLTPDDAASELTCKICFAARVDCLLLDCAHLCMCYSCAKHVKVCPFCRKVVRKRKRVRPAGH